MPLKYLVTSKIQYYSALTRISSTQGLYSNIRLSYFCYFNEFCFWLFKEIAFIFRKPIIKNVDFSYALREINLTNALLKQVYKNLLVISKNITIIYSYEVTSKDAILDSILATKIRAKCYHIRIVDMAFKESPFVVPGNRALLKNSILVDSYRKFWFKDKFKFKKVSLFYLIKK